MRPSLVISLLLSLCLFSCLLCGACSLNQSYLPSQLAERSEISGKFTVILYGARYYNDIATVALLVPEGGQYTLDIYSPEYNYRIIKDVLAADAIKIAEKFVSWHPDFLRFQTSKVLDSNGRLVAYEIRPLYNQITFGVSDVMYINYLLGQANNVVVHINLHNRVQRIFMGDDQGTIH